MVPAYPTNSLTLLNVTSSFTSILSTDGDNFISWRLAIEQSMMQVTIPADRDSVTQPGI